MSLYYFTIKGNVPALKNSKIIVTKPYPRLLPNKTVTAWNKSAKQQMRELGLENEGIDFPISLTMIIYKGTAHHYDVDNVTSTVMDLLTHVGFYKDDSLVYFLSVEKRGIDKDNPRVEIEINEV